MAVSIVGVVSTSADSNATTMTVSKPTGTVDGDIMLAFCSSDWATYAEVVAPAGWALLTGHNGGTDSQQHFKAFTKTAASEGASYIFDKADVATDQVITIVTVRGAGLVANWLWGTPTWANSSSASRVAASIAGAGAGALLLSYVGVVFNNVAGTFTPPAGMTEQADIQTTSLWQAHSVASLVSPANPTGTQTFTASTTTIEPGGGGVTWSVVIPQTGGGGTSHTANPADTIAATDTLTTAYAATRAPADTVALTDTFAAVIGIDTTHADSMGITDALATIATAARSAADTVGISDALALTRGRSSADNIGVTDAASFTTATAPPYLTSVSANGRYFLDQHGQPFQVRGDSPWSAMVWLTSTTLTDTYVEARAAQGVNTIIVSAIVGTIGNGGVSSGATSDGVTPFTSGFTFRETYWARLDYLLQKCRDEGITILMYPMDVWNNGQIGDGPFSSATTTQASNYGAAVATRYANQATYPNIVWMVGGDWFASAAASAASANLEACLDGVRSVDNTRLCSAQVIEAAPSNLTHGRSFDINRGSDWEGKLDWAFVYDWVCSYNEVLIGYNYSWSTTGGGNQTLRRPALAAEPRYWNEYSSPEWSHRRQIAWSYVAGSPGDIWGTEDWQFWSGWETRLNLPIHGEIKALRDWFGTIPWHLLVPDETLITSGAGTRVPTNHSTLAYPEDNTYALGAVTSTGTLAVLYIPTSRTIGVNTSKITGAVSALWVDPVNASTSAATFGTSYTTPGTNSGGETDWLLVIQGGALTTNPADTIGITDTLATTNTATRSGADTVGIGDTLTTATDYARSIADTVGVMDAFATVANYTRELADTVGIADAASFVLVAPGNIAAADTIGVSDQLGITAAYARSTTDAVGITDALTAEQIMTRTFADTAGIADAAMFVLGGAITSANTVSIADSAAFVLFRENQVFVEAITVTDAAVFILAGPVTGDVPEQNCVDVGAEQNWTDVI